MCGEAGEGRIGAHRLRETVQNRGVQNGGGCHLGQSIQAPTPAEWAPHLRRLGTSPPPTGHLTSADWAPHPAQ
ncbi:hypothetical protein nbrc107697_11220 [Gordonia crocea]|uniref:Uncharacterized protein n=1 Tax=Gordonia crocea TaxID=589162 RepID=A0A7I9UVW5_9ACTN|nr:hypothetical protein nbrc107697_11220 [Gordonia crocea]